ncbi:MAG: hypothetical protein ACLU3F_09400 [Blautia wexlerae]
MRMYEIFRQNIEKKLVVPYKLQLRTDTTQTASDSQTAGIADAIQTNRGAIVFRCVQNIIKSYQRLNIYSLWILVGICDLAAAGGVFYGWNILSGNYFGTPEQAFDSSEVFTNALAAKENMRTESLPRNYVFLPRNVDCIKNAPAEEGQKGRCSVWTIIKYCGVNGIYDKVYPASITKITGASNACITK